MNNLYNRTPKDTVELTAVFQKERHVFQDGTPQRCIIGEASQKDGACTNTITIKGECQPKDLLPNVEYRFAGQWKTHPKYGEQFAFSSFTEPEPITKEAIIGYLTTCPNVGMVRAEKIYDALGHGCIAQIKADPSVLRKIKGLNDEQQQAVTDFLCAKEAKEKSTLEIQSLLKGLGFPKRIYAWLDLDYGTAAASVIRANPFVMTKYRGVGFELADKVYEKLGLPPAGILRQWNYLVYLLTSDTNGSTWTTWAKAFSQMKDKFGGHAVPEVALLEAVSQQKIVQKNCDGIAYIGLTNLARCEASVVRWIYERCQQPSCWYRRLFSIKSPDGYQIPSPHQISAYYDATKVSVGLLTGSPGTGKTTLVGRIIETIQRSQGASFPVCAPTGKAALRVMESLKLQGISIIATTIHKLLDAKVGKDGWEFTYNAEYKLPHDFIIVDESSMIDIVLLKSLLDAVKDGANVLFIGDHEQLPPVGKGAPLRDMIQAGVPCGKLTEIRRNAGEIVKACAAIRDNKPIDPMPSSLSAEDNLIFWRMTPAQDKVFAAIKNIIEFERQTHETFDALQDCQVIVPLNERSVLSRYALNPLLQDYFNPLPDIGGEIVPGEHVSKVRQFRRGDKIICTKNGWVDEVYIANGEIGIVKDFTASQLTIEVNGQPVAIQTYGDWGEAEFELGYCISGHKSQGSQWDVIIVLLDPAYGAKMVCDKHWIYTAISRAKRRCYLVGMSSTLDDMIGKSHMWNRTTLFTKQFNEIGKEVQQ